MVASSRLPAHSPPARPAAPPTAWHAASQARPGGWRPRFRHTAWPSPCPPLAPYASGSGERLPAAMPRRSAATRCCPPSSETRGPAGQCAGVSWSGLVSPASLPAVPPVQRSARRLLPCSGSLGLEGPTFPTGSRWAPVCGTMIRSDCHESVSGACGSPCPPPIPCITRLALGPLRLKGSYERPEPPLHAGSLARWAALLSLILHQETIGSPTFPRHPFACLPRSQTPVVACTLALSHPGLLPAGPCTPSAFPR